MVRPQISQCFPLGGWIMVIFHFCFSVLSKLPIRFLCFCLQKKMDILSPKVIEMKAKINKQNLIKFISFCTAKEIINKIKRQPTDQEKIFLNDTTDKGLISKIYKQLTQFNKKKTKPNQKTSRRLIQIFLQRRHTNDQHMRRCSTSLLEKCKSKLQLVPPHTGQKDHH